MDRRVPKSGFVEVTSTIQYETDLAISIMQSLDDYCLELRAEEIKRKTKT